MKYVVDVAGRTVEVELDGTSARVDGTDIPIGLSLLEGSPVAMVTIGDTVHRVVVTRAEGKGRYVLSFEGRRYEAEALDERARAIRQLSASAAGPKGPAPLAAPMPGLIVRVNVEVGDQVQPGQGLVVMEAMKMENELRAPRAGRVAEVHARERQTVETGALLVVVE